MSSARCQGAANQRTLALDDAGKVRPKPRYALEAHLAEALEKRLLLAVAVKFAAEQVFPTGLFDIGMVVSGRPR